MAQCSATAKSTGSQCRQPSIPGGTVCRRHGGASPQVKAKAAVRAEVLSWRLGDSVDDPGEVLLRMVTQSRIRADHYAATIDAKIAEGRKQYGDKFTMENILIGSTYFEGHKTGEYIRGLIKLESDERDRLAGFAAKAIAAGLAERTVRIAERTGEMLGAMMLLIAGELNFTSEQRTAMPLAIRAALESVDK